MPGLRLALAQANYTVGDLAGNAAMVLDRTRTAAAAGADLVAFPELTLTGYPPEDLVLRAGFRAASRAAVEKLAGDLAAAGLGDIAVVAGYVDDDGGPRNAPRSCTAARSSRATSSTTCPTTACSTSGATSSPATGSWSSGTAASTSR